MFLIQSIAVRKVVFSVAVLAMLPGVSLAQNLSEAVGVPSGTSWHGASGGDSVSGIAIGQAVSVVMPDKSDDEPEEVVAVVIDGAQSAPHGELQTSAASQAMAKVQGFFTQLQAKLRTLMVRVSP